MAIFHSYVKLPEGIPSKNPITSTLRVCCTARPGLRTSSLCPGLDLGGFLGRGGLPGIIWGSYGAMGDIWSIYDLGFIYGIYIYIYMIYIYIIYNMYYLYINHDFYMGEIFLYAINNDGFFSVAATASCCTNGWSNKKLLAAVPPGMDRGWIWCKVDGPIVMWTLVNLTPWIL